MNASIVPISALKDNYIWAIINNETKEAWIVDPGESKPVHEFLQQQHLILKGILITHHHWDHTNGIADLKKIYDVPVYSSAKKIAGTTHLVSANEELHITDFPFRCTVMGIPGHTLEHIAYHADGNLFCGDTLFAAGCGRIFEGTPLQMYTSLQSLVNLSPATNIYCGHEYTLNNLYFAKNVEPNNPQIDVRIETVREKRNKLLASLPATMQAEKETNPFLRCDEPALIEAVSAHSGRILKNALEVFTELRKWKDNF